MNISSETLKKQETPNRIAITGGRGRLAALVASFLHNAGYEVTLFSRTGGEGFRIMSDLWDPSVMTTFDAVIHTAWSTVPFTSEQDPGQEEREDLPLLKKILESARSAAVEEKKLRFLFFSSASIYGNTPITHVKETTVPHPISSYAKGKLTAEKIIIQAAQESASFQPLVLRITNVLGFLSNPERPQGILPRIISSARSQHPLVIWGDGHCSKDYLWIDDFLLGIEAALRTPIRGIFNLGSGENLSVLQLVSHVEMAMNETLLVQYQERYPWDVACSYIDSTAFSNATGWKPQKNITEEIKRTLS